VLRALAAVNGGDDLAHLGHVDAKGRPERGGCVCLKGQHRRARVDNTGTQPRSRLGLAAVAMRHATLRIVFGLSFGELCVLLVVAMVVLGPKELPKYLRKAGLFAGRMRRLAFEMREKSGIDEVLRTEGIDRDIAEIRQLARGEITGVVSAVRSTADAARIPGVNAPGRPAPPPAPTPGGAAAQLPPAAVPFPAQPVPTVDRHREYPTEGADSYGALPDTAVVYGGSFPASSLAEDPLYVRGESPAEPAPSGETSPETAATGTAG
jgi:sec-independent protein translocase protein TatB